MAAVNLGRDTDCLAAVAAGISGALTGAWYIPEEWIKQVDYVLPVSIHISILNEPCGNMQTACITH